MTHLRPEITDLKLERPDLGGCTNRLTIEWTGGWMDKWKSPYFLRKKKRLGPQISPSRPQRSHLRPQVLNQPHNRHLHSSILLSSRICPLKSSDKSFWYFWAFWTLQPTYLLYSTTLFMWDNSNLTKYVVSFGWRRKILLVLPFSPSGVYLYLVYYTIENPG